MILIVPEDPPAIIRPFDLNPGSGNAQGPDGSELERRLMSARNLFASVYSHGYRAASEMSDSRAGEIQLAAAALRQGVDLDALLEAASRHVTGKSIRPSSAPLSESELDALVESDRQAFDEHPMS